MSTLKKDHVLGAGGAAVGGAAVGAAIGGTLAGTVGLTVGAVAGGAIGAVVGQKLSEATDPRGDLGHFEQIYRTTPYYLSDMTWADYAPAYRYGLDTYATHGGQPFEQAAPLLGPGWSRTRGASRLEWDEAQPAVAHAWRSLDEHLQSRGRGG